MRWLCVAPRYGEEILGGAEALLRGLAEHAHVWGIEAHVVTTCAVEIDLQRNVLPAGRTQVNGVPVWRYPIASLRDRGRYRYLLTKWMTQQTLTPDEEDEWLTLGPHSPRLYAHVQRYGAQYDAIILTPYVFPLVHYAASLYPQKSVIWPCLHDEALAHSEVTRALLSQSVGVIYNSEPERDLARRKTRIDHLHSVVAGIGVDDIPGDAARFRQRFNLHGPFVLYVGRLEPPKNVPLLLDYFIEYKRRVPSDMQLVLLGTGPLNIPTHPDIHSLGFMTDRDYKRDAYAAATVVCQPSVLESFSLVIMEGWLASTPALVHGDCAVTYDHVRRCNGGLYFSALDEFIGTLEWFRSHPLEQKQLGQQGRAYVQREYPWASVIDRVVQALHQWLNATGSYAA
jgi:glycosyltransferase involved in cell wall biosynthesis